MTLTVATGVLLGTADSYISVADADTYHIKLQNDDWALTDVVNKETYLTRASILINARYYDRWIDPTTYTSVPTSLKRATAEGALYSVTQLLPTVRDRGISAVTVGSISVKFDDQVLAPDMGGQGSIWDYIDILLSDITRGGTATTGHSWSNLSLERA